MSAPWYAVLWRALWLGPAMIARGLFVAIVFIGWGPDTAARAWRDTL